ncbi:hypothetical protein N7495_009607 [Penicillium taxi]|uniref:uncharacterized protein n=1 Tax=Penicillium taxi TaxID=168475 RepID=UPI002544EBAC|nr:uncharacterized protein N7495_009607 [Penicillium taxi]KAJ5885097.1 hypothetical protein N7495_009607 [Penicillium taxi]
MNAVVATRRSTPVASSRSISSKNADNVESASWQKMNPAASMDLSTEAVDIRPQYTCIPTELYHPVEDAVVPLFFNSFIFLTQVNHIRNGFLGMLPRIYTNAKVGSYLHSSTLAIAFFTVGAWTGQRSLMREAQRYFTCSLPKIREALTTDGDLNSLLAAIICLSTYEIKTTRGLSSPVIPTPTIWPLSQPQGPLSPRKVLSQASARLVDLRDTWEQIKAHQPDEAQVISILARAAEIDVDFMSWAHFVPSDWKPVSADIIPQSVHDAGVFRNRCDCYTDIWIAATWNMFRDCLMVVQSIIISCLRMLSSQDPDGTRIAGAKARIQIIADDICATVPYCLGSQMESVRMKPGLVEYPFSETRPVTAVHQAIAPLMSGWHIFGNLRNLQSPELELPPEQIIWVGQQLERVRAIYFKL